MVKIEYDLKAFQNPDGTYAVRGKATAYKDDAILTHGDELKTPVFAEVEESTAVGPKKGQDFMVWALAFAKKQGYKAKLGKQIAIQLSALGISQGEGDKVKPVSKRLSQGDL